jgi:hypothetical protein
VNIVGEAAGFTDATVGGLTGPLVGGLVGWAVDGLGGAPVDGLADVVVAEPPGGLAGGGAGALAGFEAPNVETGVPHLGQTVSVSLAASLHFLQYFMGGVTR